MFKLKTFLNNDDESKKEEVIIMELLFLLVWIGPEPIRSIVCSVALNKESKSDVHSVVYLPTLQS